MSQSGSSVISRLIDRMSPPRHRSNTEGGLTEEQEDELEHIFKVRVATKSPIPHRKYNSHRYSRVLTGRRNIRSA